MAEFASIDLRKIARLARLELTEEEITKYSEQLRQILDYVQKLDELDTSGIEPSAHAFPVFDALRKDEARPGLDQESALANAPKRTTDQFLVPKVVE